MNIAFVTPFDLKTKLEQDKFWHNPYLVSYFAAKAVNDSPNVELSFLNPKQNEDKAKIFKLKRKFYKSVSHSSYLVERDSLLLKKYSRQISQQIKTLNPNCVFSSGTMGISYLDCKQPIVFWTDVPFAGLVDFYPRYQNLAKETIRNGKQAEKSAISRAARVIYTSPWAANVAIKEYDIDPEKVFVVPRGANIEREPSLGEIKSFLQSRPQDVCRLLFLGKDWKRKGGDIAISVVDSLNEAGLKAELTIIGNEPDKAYEYPEYIKFTGFISKATAEGRQFIANHLAQSHFLLMPSRAETFGIAVCEASAFGVPTLASNVGGVPAAVRDDVNGKTFALENGIDAFCTYIIRLMQDYHSYEALAMSSYDDFCSRLNWRVIGEQLREHIKESLR